MNFLLALYLANISSTSNLQNQNTECERLKALPELWGESSLFLFCSSPFRIHTEIFFSPTVLVPSCVSHPLICMSPHPVPQLFLARGENTIAGYFCLSCHSLDSAMFCPLSAVFWENQDMGGWRTFKLCTWGHVCGSGRMYLGLRTWDLLPSQLHFISCRWQNWTFVSWRLNSSCKMHGDSSKGKSTALFN